MDKRRKSILATYLRLSSDPKDAIMPAVVAAFLLLTLLLASQQRWRLEDSILWGSLVALVINSLGFGLWNRLRQHLLSDRRALWPQYVAPHVGVFVMLACIVAVCWPVALAALSGLNVVGLIACTTALFALTGCAVTWRNSVVLAAWFAMYFGFVLAADRWPFRSLLDGSQPWLPLAVFAVAAIICWLAVNNLLTSEETGDGVYLAADVREFLRINWNSPARPSGSENLWSISKRWRVTHRTRWWMFPGMCVFNLFIQRAISGGSGPLQHGGVPFVDQVIMLDLMSVSSGWLAQWKFRENDLLRPLSRERFLKEMAAAVAVRALQFWLIFALITWAAGAILFDLPAKLIAQIECCVLALQVPIYGGTMWAMRFRSEPAVFLFSMLPLIPIGVLGMLVLFHWPHSTLVTATILYSLPAGVLMIWIGYRKWLTTEFG